MAAQTPYPIRLSSLLKMCNLDGKDRIIPMIEADEKYGEQMQMLQQQVEEMGQQIEQLQHEKENLQKTGTTLNNTLASIGDRRANGVPSTQPRKMAEAGGGKDTTSAIVDAARNSLGIPTGMALPT